MLDYTSIGRGTQSAAMVSYRETITGDQVRLAYRRTDHLLFRAEAGTLWHHRSPRPALLPVGGSSQTA